MAARQAARQATRQHSLEGPLSPPVPCGGQGAAQADSNLPKPRACHLVAEASQPPPSCGLADGRLEGHSLVHTGGQLRVPDAELASAPGSFEPQGWGLPSQTRPRAEPLRRLTPPKTPWWPDHPEQAGQPLAISPLVTILRGPWRNSESPLGRSPGTAEQASTLVSFWVQSRSVCARN